MELELFIMNDPIRELCNFLIDILQEESISDLNELTNYLKEKVRINTKLINSLEHDSRMFQINTGQSTGYQVVVESGATVYIGKHLDATVSVALTDILANLIDEVAYNYTQNYDIDILDIFQKSNSYRKTKRNQFSLNPKIKKALLRNVEMTWIRNPYGISFLEGALREQKIFNLNMQIYFNYSYNTPNNHSNNLDNSFAKQWTTDDYIQSQDIGKGVGQKILILGEPGTGKTTFVLNLIKSLISECNLHPELPVPVIFNLSSWAYKPMSIQNWLVQELKDLYKINPKAGIRLIEEEQLILILDGLDEVKASLRNQCVIELNKFEKKYSLTEVIICSRTQDYQNLNQELIVESILRIKELEYDQVHKYLTESDNRLEALKKVWQKDAEFRNFATTPLVINIMSIAYGDKKLEELPGNGLTKKERYRHLFDAYVSRVLFEKSLSPGLKKERKYSILSHIKYKYSVKEIYIYLSWISKKIINSKPYFFIEMIDSNFMESREKQKGLKIMALKGFQIGIIFGILLSITSTIYSLVTGRIYEDITNIILYFFIGSIVNGLVFAFMAIIWNPLIWNFSQSPNKSTNPFPYFFLKLTLKTKSEISKELTIKKLLINIGLYLVINVICIPLYWIFNKILSFQFPKTSIEATIIFFICTTIFYIMLTIISTFFEYNWYTDYTSKPNQGIFRTLKISSFFTFLLISFSLGLFLSDKDYYWAVLLLGIMGIDQGGGHILWNHFSTRFILYTCKFIPWNYTNFLDFAAERILLRKVGGGYIFIHRMLMEYFANYEI